MLIRLSLACSNWVNSEKVNVVDNLRTHEVDELLTVLSRLDDPDTIYALLQDLFTVR